MNQCDFQDAMTRAEIACGEHLAKFLGVPVYLDANPDNPDCGVFNIGYMYTGEHNAYRASAYHFRGTLELFCRNRTELQRTIMRLLDHYPINADCRADDELRQTSNVLVFRIPLETRAVGEVVRTDIQTKKDAKPILTYNATVSFDVVFQARFDR